MNRALFLALALLFPIALLAPAQAFFEFFGGSRSVQPPAFYSPPLDIKVRPRAKKASARNEKKPKLKLAHKKELGSRDKKKVRVAKASPTGHEPKLKRMPSINPEAVPDWFLKDPTLRSGDILVLKTGPVVFKSSGSKVRQVEDFASLKGNPMISKAGQRDIGMAFTGVWTPPTPEDAAPARRSRRRVATAH